MEFLNTNNIGGQGYGFILYKTKFDKADKLKITGAIQDRAHVIVNGRLAKTIYHEDKVDTTISLSDLKSTGNGHEIIVENMGRVNYQHLKNQRKGFQGEVSADEQKLTKWEHVSLEFCDKFVDAVRESKDWMASKSGTGTNQTIPTLYRGYFEVDKAEDTFIDMTSWKKGIVLINGYNLGRYWRVGPQQTLYIPNPLLKKGKNEVIVFELEEPASGLQAKFVENQVLDSVQK